MDRIIGIKASYVLMVFASMAMILLTSSASTRTKEATVFFNAKYFNDNLVKLQIIPSSSTNTLTLSVVDQLSDKGIYQSYLFDGNCMRSCNEPVPSIEMAGNVLQVLDENRIAYSKCTKNQSGVELSDWSVSIYNTSCLTESPFTFPLIDSQKPTLNRVFPPALVGSDNQLAIFHFQLETGSLEHWECSPSVSSMEPIEGVIARGWASICKKQTYIVFTNDGEAFVYDDSVHSFVSSECYTEIGVQIAAMSDIPTVGGVFCNDIALWVELDRIVILTNTGRKEILKLWHCMDVRPDGIKRKASEMEMAVEDPAYFYTEGLTQPASVVNRGCRPFPYDEHHVGLLDPDYNRVIMIENSI
jgi:hypothetical protein